MGDDFWREAFQSARYDTACFAECGRKVEDHLLVLTSEGWFCLPCIVRRSVS